MVNRTKRDTSTDAQRALMAKWATSKPSGSSETSAASRGSIGASGLCASGVQGLRGASDGQGLGDPSVTQPVHGCLGQEDRTATELEPGSHQG